MPRYYVSDACSAMVGKTDPYFIKFFNKLLLATGIPAARSGSWRLGERLSIARALIKEEFACSKTYGVSWST
jgi:hypothetical protein